MKLPVNGKWSIDQSNERGVALLATKNIDFDKQGIARLSNRTIDVFDETDDATFTAPIGAFTGPALTQIAGTATDPFIIDITTIPLAFAVSAAANRPTLSQNSSQAFFNNKWYVSENGGLRSMTVAGAWTAESLTSGPTSGKRHPLAVHKANNTLLMGDGNIVRQVNTSMVNTQDLTLAAGIEVVGLAYNRNFVGIITWDSVNREAWFYVWDGGTAAANYAYPLGANRALFVVAWKNTFALLNGAGQLLQWTDAGLDQLAALPSFYTTAILAAISDRLTTSHDTGAIVDGNRIFMNLSSFTNIQNSEKAKYNPRQPAGIWCFDPNVGLYHRYAPSSAKLLYKLSTSPNLGTDVLTVSATVPATGTPCVYTTADGTVLGGTLTNTIYYVIYVSATTFKLAKTRANALAGTAIDLTSDTAPSNEYKFLFFPESDFGQVATQTTTYGGMITKTGIQQTNVSAAGGFSVFQKFAFGFKKLDKLTLGSETDVFGFIMDRAFNRGWLMTQRMYSPNITDTFKKIFLKARNLLTEHDKVIVKFRCAEDLNMPVITPIGGSVYGTYTAANQFTTTADLSAAKTAFDAGHPYEIEIITGAGAGYLAHISAITYSAPTYTVTIDETIRNVSVGNTFYFVVDNWEKLLTKGGEEGILSTSNVDYSEFPIGRNTSWLQLRIEFRGFQVGLEEIELANTGDKPAL